MEGGDGRDEDRLQFAEKEAITQTAATPAQALVLQLGLVVSSS